jgi:branched-subunit amino acid aminotransferase/4-amino-4-deoxychorismate lyase
MARTRVFFDGSIRWEEEALISPLCTGLLYGDGVFDVMRGYEGVPFRFADHYERLRTSCEALRLNLIYDEENLWLIVRELLRQNDATQGDSYIRITVFGSELNMISSPDGVTTHTFAHVRPFTPPKPAKYKSGVSVRISSYRTSPYNPTAGHHTICFLPMILARRAAWQRGLDEVLIQNTEGGVCEGSTSNLFIVSREKITTAPAEDGIQRDVARDVVIELAEELGISIREKTISQKMLMGADEVFIANSLIEVMPVKEIEGTVVGPGSAGPVTAQLLAAYRKKVKGECSGG